MKTIRKVLTIILPALACLLLLGEGSARSDARRAESDIYQQLRLFSDVLSTVKGNYVEEVDSQALITGALKGMLSALDPYSQFLDASLFRELEIGTEGRFGGVGMVITVRDELISVVTPIEDTPAFRAGMRTDDRIVRIGEESTRGMTSSDAANLLRGEPGTDVDIEVLREGEPELLKITLTREIIQLQSVKTAEFLEDTRIAYVRLTEFQQETYNDLKKALEPLREEGMTGLILDLRSNPGGLLDSAIRVANLFLPPDKLVVYTRGRGATRYQEYRTRRNEMLIDESVPLVVMINRGSASGSEIIAGALSDWNRAVLLGERSFGKASVQTVIPLRVEGFEGTALKLTIAHYHTPNDRRIEGEGIMPDIEISQTEGTPGVYSSEFNLEDDAQLQRAFDLLRGLTIWRDGERGREKNGEAAAAETGPEEEPAAEKP